LALFFDFFQDIGFKTVRSNPKMSILTFEISDKHVAEECGSIAANVLIGCYQRKIGVELGGFFIIVACTDLCYIVQFTRNLTGDETDF
jgi:hypothetical protein